MDLLGVLAVKRGIREEIGQHLMAPFGQFVEDQIRARDLGPER